MKLFSVRCVALVLALSAVATCVAQKNNVKGALWKYEMTPVDGEGARKGTFRIQDADIFQRREKKQQKVGKIEGQAGKPKKGDQVQVEFESLVDDDGTRMKAKGPITFDSFGEVHGRLVDGQGKHWEFKASRFQE